jgi:ribonuclease Z
MMELIFLGTTGAVPTLERSHACVCLVRDGEILMFDAGEGAQISYLKSNLGWNKKMKIFVTHLHGDHCIGILGLLQTMTLRNRTEPIEIYGPKGIEEFIAANTKIMNFGLSFPVLITQVSEGTVVSEEKYEVRTCEAEHSVPTFSFLLEEKEKPGTFYPEKAISIGIPKGELWHKLQQGEEVVVDGKSIKPSEVVGPNVPGKKIGISGDTRPTKKLETFFKNCDYLVFDSTFLDELKENAILTCHSTAKEAATFAKNTNVSNLILTHFSARYKDENVLLDEAKTVHSSVIAAHDQLKIDII